MWHKFIQPHSTIGRDTNNNNNNNNNKEKKKERKKSQTFHYTHTLCRSNLIWLK